MTWFSRVDGTWTETGSPADDGPSIQVRASETDLWPELRFRTEGRTFFDVSGVERRPNTDTTHTVALVDPESMSAEVAFAVHGSGNDLVFEDCRDPDDSVVSDEMMESAQSALHEILVPVYIDDVVSDLSKRGSGLAVVHTIQADERESDWSYFRTSIFRDGELILEEEKGALSA